MPVLQSSPGLCARCTPTAGHVAGLSIRSSTSCATLIGLADALPARQRRVVLLIAVYLHIFRASIPVPTRRPRELLWILGVITLAC